MIALLKKLLGTKPATKPAPKELTDEEVKRFMARLEAMANDTTLSQPAR